MTGKQEQSGRRQRRRRGFTLIELLVVLVILGLVAAIAVPQVIKYVGSAKSDTARIQIERLATALDLYRLEVGRYPSNAEGMEALVERPTDAESWNGPYLKERDISDPWGRPYVYAFPGEGGRDYDLLTLGADGREGGDGEDADIAN